MNDLDFDNNIGVHVTNEIDLSKVPPPEIIAAKSFDSIKSEMVAILKKEMGEDFYLSDGDPTIKMLEIAANREVKLRQEINDAAKNCLLAFAKSINLDNVTAPFGVIRENPNTSDDTLRKLTLLSFERFSTAGAKKAYIYHATKIGDRYGLIDVYPYSDKEGNVTVTLLFNHHSSENREKWVKEIENYLKQEDIKPLTDTVTVIPATIVDVKIKATIYVPQGDKETIKKQAELSFNEYAMDIYRIYEDVTVSGLHSALKVPNVRKVALDNFATDYVIKETEVARISLASLTVENYKV